MRRRPVIVPVGLRKVKLDQVMLDLSEANICIDGFSFDSF